MLFPQRIAEAAQKAAADARRAAEIVREAREARPTPRTFDASPNPEGAARGPFAVQPRVNFRHVAPAAPEPERAPFVQPRPRVNFRTPTVTERGGDRVDVDLSRYGGGQFANLTNAREVAPGAGIRGTGVTGIERVLDPTNLSRGSGAFLGSIREMESSPVYEAPLAAARGAVKGFRDPNDFGGGAESSLGQQIPEPYRGIGGAVIETVFDPLDLATGGTLGTDAVRLGARGVRALSDDAAQTAIRAAEGPLEASGRGLLRNTETPGAIDPVIPGVTPRGRAAGGRGGAPLADEIPDLPRTTAAVTPEFEQAYPALLDSLRNEVRLRRGGTISGEIAEGRSRQAAGIAGNLDAARQSGAGLEESLAAAKSGAKTGTLRQTFAVPLELTTAQKNALSDHLQEALSTESPFKRLTGLEALNNLVRGENVQPAQLKLLRAVFGDEVARAAKEAATGRPSAVAQLDDEARAAIERGAEIGEKQIVRYEQQAIAQERLANELTEKLRLDPTNQRLANLAEQARVKGLDAANKADELVQNQAARFAAEAEARNAARAARGPNQAREVLEAERRDKRAPNTEQLLNRAKAILGETESASAIDQQVIKSIDTWIQANRDILDTIGETRWNRMADTAAAMSGNLADSYLTALYQRKTLLEGALVNQGWDEALARKVSQLLTERELQLRYPGGVPERLQAEIAKTKPIAYGDNAGSILRGAAAYSQEWKNLAFGPADVGVFGQQVLKTASMSPTNILAGAVNRTLSAMHLPAVPPTMVDEKALNKYVQYQLDGVPQGITTGIVQDADATGTALKHIPLIKRLDPTISKWIEFSTDLQFRRVLGGLRNLNYEGNLVALHLMGQDITNASVRATAAGMANAATSYAPRALNQKRALAESAGMMTPSMRRAQVTSILQMARAFSPRATQPERILGSIAILNLAGATLAVGKLLSDRIGAPGFEFEMDPSKPGFGSITTAWKNSSGENVIINLFPQQQVVTTIAESVRNLAEGDPQAAAEEWAKLFIGSSGPALQVLERAAGVGYQPGSGYKFGDLNEGIPIGERVLNMLPLPPIFQSYLNEGLNPLDDPGQFGLEGAGIPNYGESGYAEGERILEGSEDLTSGERKLELASTEEGTANLERRDEETLRAASRGDRIAQALSVSIRQRDEFNRIAEDATSLGEYVARTEDLRQQFIGERRTFEDVFEGFEESDIQAQQDAARWYDNIDAATTGLEVDWERFDQLEAELIAELGEERWNAAQAVMGIVDPRYNEYEQQFQQVKDDLNATGFRDIADLAWDAVQKAIPNAAEYDDYYDWLDATEAKFISNLSKSMPRGNAEVEAKNLIAKFPQAELYSEFKNARETQWIAKNPEMADIAQQAGLLRTNKAERGLIGAGATP